MYLEAPILRTNREIRATGERSEEPIGVPVGALALLFSDPTGLRWAIGLFVVLAASAMRLSEGRQRRQPSPRATRIVGLISGFCGGAFQMEGPPVVIFWLGGPNASSVVRANAFVFIFFVGLAVTAFYAALSLLTFRVAIMAFCFAWPFFLGLETGKRLFRVTSDRIYRDVAYTLIVAAGAASLPFHWSAIYQRSLLIFGF
jgi:uncharacterized membrane protein YfcA